MKVFASAPSLNRAARASLLAAAAGLAIGAFPGHAFADHHGHWHGHWHGPYRGYAGGYYPPPPVVYGRPYYAPPPVVYGPGIGLNIHIP
jgi:hypothetical protein